MLPNPPLFFSLLFTKPELTRLTTILEAAHAIAPPDQKAHIGALLSVVEYPEPSRAKARVSRGGR